MVQTGIQAFVQNEQIMKDEGVQHRLLVEQVYRNNNYRFIWLPYPDLQNDLYQMITSAPVYGLEEKDYQYPFIHSFRLQLSSLISARDSIMAEIRLTDAAIHFLNDVKNGNAKPFFSYDGLQYEPSFENLPELLYKSIHKGQLDSLVSSLEPRSKEYFQMKEILALWNKTIYDSSFKEVKITSSSVTVENVPLVKKLKQLGITTINEELSNKKLTEKVILAQRMFDLNNDGVLGIATMNALNIPLSARIYDLKLAINYIRWLSEIKQSGKIALLNIPSAQLLVYDRGSLTIESKIIAGKPSTPTSTLTSTIKEVIIYPYWNIPYSIATKEILPRVKRSLGYLGRNNYQVLNKQGKIVDPYTINWYSLSTSHFPYLIRQATGCDNALGIIKFNFYNPFSIYLHDTPSKSLFLMKRRFFSHGCMRVEKPVEFARFLLKEKASLVETLMSQCLKDQSPLNLQLEEPLSIMVFYSTAWYDEQGQIKFYEDIYNKMSNQQSLNALRN
jgi:L,D-transpeptidase YcbB